MYMKLTENKKEISLQTALTLLLTNNVPDQHFEFTVSNDETDDLLVFGKAYTKKDPANWGKSVCKYFVHKQYCPCIPYDSCDKFMIDLLQNDMFRNNFHVWESEN